jgi:hypothetical protein
MIPPGRDLLVVLKNSAGSTLPYASWKTFTDSKSPWKVARISYSNLQLGEVYHFEVYDKSHPGILLDYRELHALDVNKANPKLAFISCMNDKFDFPKVFGIWTNLDRAPQPDLVFFLGDNVYVDVGFKIEKMPNGQDIWQRYVEIRQALPVYRMQNLIPIVATWDDHDYGFNNQGKDYPYRAESTYVFQSFFAQDPVPGLFDSDPAFSEVNTEKLNRERKMLPRLGIAAALHAFHQDFLLLDGRSFRDAGERKGSMLGIGQQRWMISELKKSNRPAWVLNGSQYFGAYHSDESFELEFPDNFKWFISALKNVKRDLILVSGDRHMSEVMDTSNSFGYPTYELSSSGIHSYKLYDHDVPPPNPRRVSDRQGRTSVTDFNFMVVDVVDLRPTPKLEINIWGEENRLLYSQSVRFGRPR